MLSTIKNTLVSSVTFFLLTFAILANSNSQTALDIYSIKYAAENSAAYAGDYGQIFKTKDGGMTWTQQTLPVVSLVNYKLYANDYYSIQLGAAAGETGTILTTYDEGSSWIVRESGTEEALRSIKFANENVIVAIGDHGTILRSEDAGKTWTSIPVATTENLNDLQFVNENDGFAVGDNMTFAATTDGGRSFHLIVFGGPNFYGVYMLNETDGTVVGEDGLIYKTRDGGHSWSGNAGQLFSDNLRDIRFLNNSVGIAVGDNGVIARTEDEGMTWHGVESPVSADLLSIDFTLEHHGIAVGKDGTVINTNDGGLTWNPDSRKGHGNPRKYESSNLVASKFDLSQNFPNPFNPSTKINYQLPSDSRVTLQVFDMTGREVRSLVNGNQTAGNYSVTLDAKDLSSGIYFYRISAVAGTGSFVKTMKMMLVK